MDSGKLFQIATQIKTPLMLAALVILVLFALYRFILRSGAANVGIAAKIPENIALYLFILALVALVLGITADKYVHSQTEEKHWLYGKVHSPPSDRTQGVPDALVYIDTGQTTKVATDPLGDFKYEIG